MLYIRFFSIIGYYKILSIDRVLYSRSLLVIQYSVINCSWSFPGGLLVGNPHASVGDAGLIPGSGRSPGRRAWQPTPVFLPGVDIPWTEEPGRLQSMGSEKSWTRLSN